jgi:hypothetical protein
MANFILSWLSAILVLLCAAIWPLRKICAKHGQEDKRLVKKIWLFLRKIHIPLGLLTTAVVFLHCRMAFEISERRSFLGGILLVCMLGLCATGFMKRLLPRYWIRLHRGITAIMFIILFIHCFIEFNI